MPKIAKLSFKHLGAAYLLITALTATPSFAQIKPGNLTQFTEQDGLPGIQVNSLLQDKFGYMWVGTINELARYDGYEFKRFYNNPNDSTSINGLIVWSIYEDKEGLIWIGTSPENLNVYNPITKSFRHYPFKHLVDHLANFEIGIVTMCEDQQDRIYFGVGSQYNTIKPGLLYYDKKEDQIKKFIAPDSLEIQIALDKNDNIWIGTNKGLYYFDRKKEKFEVFENESNKQLEQTTINALKFDSFGTLWLATYTKGLFKYEERALLKSYSYIATDKNSITPGWVNNIYEAKNGQIWITTSGQGLTSGINELNPQTGTLRTWPFKTTWQGGLRLAVFAADRYFRNRVIQKERERSRTRELEQAREIQKAYTELKATQAQLIQSSSGQKEPTDINALANEYLRLAYHGLRAKDKSFNATMKTDFDETIGKINVIPQDIGRVILNLITNAFYAVNEKKRNGSLTPERGIENAKNEYEPTVTVKTSLIPPSGGGGALISVRDNGPGIPASIVDKIFQPFFTTKPTGEGTGLGLSLSYDIVKAHGGELKVETKEAKDQSLLF